MPYRIDPNNSNCVQVQKDGEWQQEKCHDDADMAKQHLAALNANVEEAKTSTISQPQITFELPASATITSGTSGISSYKWQLEKKSEEQSGLGAIKSTLDKLYQAIINPNGKDLTQSSFKVVNNHWFARYSNAFKDREDEYFPRKAIDNYIRRVDTGLVDMPELWVWHLPKAIGQTKVLTRVGNFVVAAGTFNDDVYGQTAKDYLSTHKAKNSHGFVFDTETFKEASYWDYNTFEISILPFDKGVEANAYTNTEVKTMSTITPDKRKFLAEMFGEDVAQQFIEDTEKASKALEEIGVQFKDFTTLSDDKEGEKSQTSQEQETVLFGDVVSDLAELAQGQVKLLKVVKEQQKQLEAQQKEIAGLRDELAMPATRASEDHKTIVDIGDDEQLTQLWKALKEKEAKAADPIADFWNDWVEEA